MKWEPIGMEEFEELVFGGNGTYAHTLPSDIRTIIYYDQEAYDRGEIKTVAKAKVREGYSGWNEMYNAVR